MWRPEDQPPGVIGALRLEFGMPATTRRCSPWCLVSAVSLAHPSNGLPWLGRSGCVAIPRNPPRTRSLERLESLANETTHAPWNTRHRPARQTPWRSAPGSVGAFPERRPALRCEVVCLLASMGGLRFGLTRTYALALMTIRRMFLLQMQSHLVPKIEHAFFPGGSLVLRSKAILLGHAQSNLRLLLHCPLQRA